MEGYSTESEQLEALRKWWDRNGRWVVTGLVIAALVVGGWRLWGYWQAKRAGQAAGLYAAVVQAEEKGDTASVRKAAQRVVHAYPDTAYGALAGLSLAKARFAQHDFQGADEALRTVIAHSPDQGLAGIARVRLARVQMQMGNPGAALRILKGHENGAFAAMVNDVRGDALMALGHRAQARKVYEQALAGSAPGSSLHQLLQLRLASLPAPASAAAPAGSASPAAPAASGAKR